MKPHLLKLLIPFVVLITATAFIVAKTKGIEIPSFSIGSSQVSTTVTSATFSPTESDKKVILKFSDINYLIENGCSSTLENVRTEERNGNIIATGKAKYPYSSNFEATIGFRTEDKRLISEIKYLKIGKIESPSFINSRISDPLQKIIDSKIKQAISSKKC
jgi:hypothetical protein